MMKQAMSVAVFIAVCRWAGSHCLQALQRTPGTRASPLYAPGSFLSTIAMSSGRASRG
jgi:hypothetical protein